MKIIAKIKDYYDYLQNVYGIDNLVVYDRRICKPLNTNKETFDYGDNWFRADKNEYVDKRKQTVRYYSSKSFCSKVKNRFDKHLKFIEEGDIDHFVLEVGFFQYLFETERYLNDDDKLILDYKLISSKRVDKSNKFSNYPMAIARANAKYGYFLYKDGEWEVIKNTIEPNPILINTWIPKVIQATDIWEHLYEYISSLNDKEIIDSRTNIEHIESNGFDKKTSFRGKLKRK